MPDEMVCCGQVKRKAWFLPTKPEKTAGTITESQVWKLIWMYRKSALLYTRKSRWFLAEVTAKFLYSQSNVQTWLFVEYSTHVDDILGRNEDLLFICPGKEKGKEKVCMKMPLVMWLHIVIMLFAYLFNTFSDSL